MEMNGQQKETKYRKERNLLQCRRLRYPIPFQMLRQELDHRVQQDPASMVKFNFSSHETLTVDAKAIMDAEVIIIPWK